MSAAERHARGAAVVARAMGTTTRGLLCDHECLGFVGTIVKSPGVRASRTDRRRGREPVPIRSRRRTSWEINRRPVAVAPDARKRHARFQAVVARAMARPLEITPQRMTAGAFTALGVDVPTLRGRRCPAKPNMDGSRRNDDNPAWETARRDP